MSSNARYRDVVIFGGGGYIGSFFAAHLLAKSLADTIYLVDITRRKERIWPTCVREALIDGRVRYLDMDVREYIAGDGLPNHCGLACNFAAVHREPGHADREYFETNIKGAENVCDWADRVGCTRMIFTSSIAPYGLSEDERAEDSTPVPVTAYGSSKLVAERIHLCWLSGARSNRFLSIVRPGVIFGPGEDGNVPRMIRAIKKRYFIFAGNKQTVKAGGYVKELCRAMQWVITEQEERGERLALYNFSFPDLLCFRDYVDAIKAQLGHSGYIPSVPFPVVLVASWVISLTLKPFRISHPFDPVRVGKLVTSNKILPTYLVKHGYQFEYDLGAALADWRKDAPKDWE